MEKHIEMNYGEDDGLEIQGTALNSDGYGGCFRDDDSRICVDI